MTKLVRFNINFYADGAIKYAINMHYAQTEETLRCVSLGQAELIEVTVAIGRAQELADKARKAAAVAVERANEAALLADAARAAQALADEAQQMLAVADEVAANELADYEATAAQATADAEAVRVAAATQAAADADAKAAADLAAEAEAEKVAASQMDFSKAFAPAVVETPGA